MAVEFNKFIVAGNLGRDAEYRPTQSGAHRVQFSVANSKTSGRGDQRQTNTSWFNVTWFGEQAKNLFDKGGLVKGTPVLLSGSLELRDYEKDGVKRTSADLTLDSNNGFQFLGGRQQQAEDAPAPTISGTQEVEDVPF